MDRVLGGIIAKFKNFRNTTYHTYNRLFDAGVVPILDYCSGVWGYDDFENTDKVQYTLT